jgi:DNA-binding HxlR family transcriptional regulator
MEVVSKMKVAFMNGAPIDPLQPGVDCSPDCPVKLAADILSGKWTTLIIRELLAGKRRYSQLQHALLGISPKILASRLRMLEANGLVTRKIYPTIPPKTEYSLTKMGQELEPVIRAMAVFGLSLGQSGHAQPRESSR